MLQLLYRLIKHDLNKQKIRFKVSKIEANKNFILTAGMLCIIRPNGKTLGIYNADGTRIVSKDVGYTIAFCCDLGEGGATGADFKAFFTYENELSLLDISNILGTSQVVCKEGSYLKNNSTSTIDVYYVTRG